MKEKKQSEQNVLFFFNENTLKNYHYERVL